MIVQVPGFVRVIGGCHAELIGEIGVVKRYDFDGNPAKRGYEEIFWLEFKDHVFEGADSETQHANRAYFFGPEVELVK